MNHLSQIITRLRSRSVLIIIAIGLVILNVGRMASSQYNEYYQGIESKQDLLGQYQISTKNIDSMRKRIKQLEGKKKQMDSLMFTGASKQEITSAIQIKIQELLGRANLTPESLAPARDSNKNKDKQYGDVSVKIRLTAQYADIIQFLKELYQLDYLLKVDNFTLKPFKGSQLKVFLELKGFYKLTTAPEENHSDN